MVKYEEESFWTCPYCGKEYNNENDANECAEECADIDRPREDTKTVYVCEFCEKKYDKEEEAKVCEEHHAKNNDDCYSKEMLRRTSEHPGQKKLL